MLLLTSRMEVSGDLKNLARNVECLPAGLWLLVVIRLRTLSSSGEEIIMIERRGSDCSGGFGSTEPPITTELTTISLIVLTTNKNNVTIKSLVQATFLRIIRCGVWGVSQQTNCSAILRKLQLE